MIGWIRHPPTVRLQTAVAVSSLMGVGWVEVAPDRTIASRIFIGKHLMEMVHITIGDIMVASHILLVQKMWNGG